MKRKTATRLVYGTAAALIALGGYLLGRCTKADYSPSELVTEDITVHTGDTLWEIGEKYCPNNMDIRRWIDRVMEINGLSDALIYPGDELTILVSLD